MARRALPASVRRLGSAKDRAVLGERRHRRRTAGLGRCSSSCAGRFDRDMGCPDLDAGDDDRLPLLFIALALVARRAGWNLAAGDGRMVAAYIPTVGGTTGWRVNAGLVARLCTSMAAGSHENLHRLRCSPRFRAVLFFNAAPKVARRALSFEAGGGHRDPLVVPAAAQSGALLRRG